ncbi:hypothetical protein [Flavisphingomonas formosensis]|uniref:hypothetical protein n=1 Tax=Flavisphingomonas formosensis TaxID=861534 RepID=UPI0012F9DEAA|nr:hypothetical protein [Sphingomonas formosensis]
MTDTTSYSPALIPAARTLAARGALDKDLATAFGVSFTTIRAWKQQHPDFAAACRLSPEAADAAVERALFRLATGHDRETEQLALKDGELIRTTVTEHVPPNDKAAIFWLRIRRPERWAAPMVIRRAGPDDLTPTEETLREIEHVAYEAWSAAIDGEPEMAGDADTLARVDALAPATAPADDTDPLQILETLAPHPSSQRKLGSLSTIDRSLVESDPSFRWDDGKEESDTLPHRIHPPLPAPITAPLVETIDADPPAPAARYAPAFVPLARALAGQGALDRDLAHAFGVTTTTIRQWTLRHAAFGQAVRLPKDVADDAVEAALFARATGYSHVREKLLRNDDGDIIRTRTRVEQPPSLAAILFWLSRCPDHRWSLNARPDLDPDEAAALIAETRERVADYDLHRRHWRTHGCAPPGRDEPEPPEWLWDDEDLAGDEDEDASGFNPAQTPRTCPHAPDYA